MENVAGEELAQALTIAGKQDRDNAVDAVKTRVYETLAEPFAGRESELGNAFRSVTK